MNLSVQNTCRCLICFLIPAVIFTFFSCGSSDSGSGGNTGSYAAKLVFPADIPRIESESDPDQSDIDCKTAGIGTIRCALFSADDTLITETRWQCSQGKGIVNNAPIGSSITVRVTAEDDDGMVILRGEEAKVSIEANRQTPGNEIFLQWVNFPNITAGSEPKTLEFDWAHIDFPDSVDHYQLQVDPDGDNDAYQFTAIEGAEYIEETNATLSVPIHLTDWFTALYRVVALDAVNNVIDVSNDVDLITTLLPEEVIGYFKASNTGVEDNFGYDVALSADGNTLAVGAVYEDSNSQGVNPEENDNSENSGAVYVFTKESGTWRQQAYIKSGNTGEASVFGFTVALAADGNTLAVGAPGEDMISLPDVAMADSGAVYVFTRQNGTWNQQAHIQAGNPGEGDQFGSRLALAADGDTLAVGAYYEDSDARGINNDENDNLEDSGAVYVFRRTNAAWDQQAYVKADNSGEDDRFGCDVALSGDGNTLAVGAYWEDGRSSGINGADNNDAQAAGAVYLFTYQNGAWDQQAYIKHNNTERYEAFGVAVALSEDGNTLAVGAYAENNSNTDEDIMMQYAGAAYVFTNESDGWRQQAYIKASNPDEGDQFGYTLALSGDGDVLAVGANHEKSAAVGINGDDTDNSLSDAGTVYVFERRNFTWLQQAYTKASNTDSGDRFGFSLALSHDGGTMAVGAHVENGGAQGITRGVNQETADNSAENAGAVYLY